MDDLTDSYHLLRDKKFLSCDDDELNQSIIQDIFAANGLDCDVVYSGKEAVEKARATEYDFILLDIMMPDMDGQKVLNQIRADGLNKWTPVLALTGKNLEGDREKILSGGFDYYMSKPFTEQQLLSYLLSYFIE